MPIADPDSLKTLSDGSLILTSDHDASLTIISHPGTSEQSASFVTLPAGSSGLDDAIIPTSTSGTFVISNAGANDVVKVNATGLHKNDIYVAVGSDNAIDQLDPTTGALIPVITGLNSPHGMMFIPADGSTSGTASDNVIAQDHAVAGVGMTAADFPMPASVSGGSASSSGTAWDQIQAGSMAMLPTTDTSHATVAGIPQQS